MSDQQYPTPLEMFYKWEKEIPNEVYFRQPFAGKWHEITFKEAGRQVRCVAAALKNRNLPDGAKVAIISKNCAHWIMSDLAIMMAGLVSVPLYPNISAEKINYCLEHSGAKVAFIGKLDDWASMKSGLPAGVHGISYPMYEEAGYQNWDALCKSEQPIMDNPVLDRDKLCSIIYTSGTTGNPKGVMHSAHNFAYASKMATQVLTFGNASAPRGQMFSYLPLSHIAERSLVEMGSLASGATINFAESLDTFAANLAYSKPTVFLAVPRIWTKFQMGILGKMPQKKLNTFLKIPILSGIVKKKIKAGLGLENCNHFLTGAAPMSLAMQEWYKKLGIVIQDVYGMTEDTAYSHSNNGTNIKFGTVGVRMPSVESKITDEGEIAIKSNCIMLGYYNDPEKTAETIRDGYLHTGDQGEYDNEGFLRITGRVKDLFKTAKGKYVVPNPIEMQFGKNEFVEQVCVVGSGLQQPIVLVYPSEAGRSMDRKALEDSLCQTLKEVNGTVEKHEKLNSLIVVKDEWTIENELLTPTLKIKRNAIDQKYGELYQEWCDCEGAVSFE